MTKKAVIIFSGGLDSTTCLAIAKDQGFDCYALSFSYGQKHSAEILAAKRIAKSAHVKEHKILTLPIGDLGGSSLTDDNIEIPNHGNDNKIPSTYVPARNTIFLSFALGYAEVVNAQAIFIGASCVDYSGYPDCRPEYFSAIDKVYQLATKQAVNGAPVTLHTPLIHLSKADTIKRGVALGVDYSQTVSCYRANDEGLACGQCDSCHLRKKGFDDAGAFDPTHYIKNQWLN